MGHSYAEDGRQAPARRAGLDQPRPGRGRGAQGRHALARGAGAARRRASWASPTSWPATTSSWSGARDNTLDARRLPGRQHQPHQPRRHRHRGQRAAADARPGHDRGHRRDRLPARPDAAWSRSKLRELGVQKVMTMTSTYDHRVIQGAESGAFLRRVDALLQGEDGFYEGVFEAIGPARGGPGRQHAGGGDRRRARARGRHPRRGAGGRRGAAPGRAGRHLGGQGPPHARPPGRAARPARLRADRRSGARPGARSTSPTS